VSLFNAADTVKAKIAERRTGTHRSPQYAALMAENQRLRSALRRIGALERRTDILENMAEEQQEWNAECELYVKNDVPSVPQVECRSCHRSYPHYPIYWPGGFHGSTEPICASCKPEREYLASPHE
jgi:hypothetical protein